MPRGPPVAFRLALIGRVDMTWHVGHRFLNLGYRTPSKANSLSLTHALRRTGGSEGLLSFT
jgi:hypothetical protein